MKFFGISILLFLPMCLFAQQMPDSGLEQEKKVREAVDQQVETLTRNLGLDDWQVFYVDSILTHDLTALSEEFASLKESKVGNMDIYQQTQDKWMEQIYASFEKVFDKTQWSKYLKSGASRDKKARDKRAAKKK